MPDTPSVVIVNGSPNQRSKTGALIDLAVEALGRHLDIAVTEVRPYALGPGFTGAASREEVSGDVEATLQAIERADLLIVGVPVYRGTYPGMFKHLFDLIDQYALEDMPVLLMATGGSERHSMMLEHQLVPLFAFFQSSIVPVTVYGSAGDFIDTTLYNPPVLGRIERAAAMAANLLRGERQRRAVRKVAEPIVA